MTAKLRAQRVIIGRLDDATRQAMWELFASYYAEVMRAQLEADLDKKQAVILLRDTVDGALRGFSALLLARNFPEHWPRHERLTTPWQTQLIDVLAREKFGSAWQPDLGILRFEKCAGRLGTDLALHYGARVLCKTWRRVGERLALRDPG
ncbi:MAG: hypothetical protein AAB426_08830 [Myxococcota bacterium]